MVRIHYVSRGGLTPRQAINDPAREGGSGNDDEQQRGEQVEEAAVFQEPYVSRAVWRWGWGCGCGCDREGVLVLASSGAVVVVTGTASLRETGGGSCWVGAVDGIRVVRLLCIPVLGSAPQGREASAGWRLLRRGRLGE